MNSKKIGTTLIFIGIILITIGSVLSLISRYSASSKSNNKNVGQSDFSDDRNVAEYYDKWGKVVKIEDVKDNKDIMTEKEVFQFLKKRGITECSIDISYTMDGKITLDDPLYCDDEELATDKKHPIYIVGFMPLSSDRLWSLVITGKSISASPILEEDSKLTVTESKTFVSYALSGNKYYYVIPNADELDLKIVKKIDLKTIKKIDKEFKLQN